MEIVQKSGEPSSLLTPQFALLSAATFLAVMPAGMLLPTVPLYAQSQLAAGDAAVGVAVGAASLTAFFALPWVGRFADGYGRRRFLLAGPLIVAAAALSLHVAAVLVVLVAVRVLAGVGEAMVAVAATTAATDLAPAERRGEAISVFSLAFQGGIAVGPVVATELLQRDRYGLVWTAAAASALVAAMLAARICETRPPGERRPPSRLISRPALLPGSVLALGLVGYGGFTAFAAIYARELGLERVGFVFLLFAVTVITLRTAGRTIPDRLGPRRCAALALSLITAGLLVIAATGSLSGLFVGAATLAAGHALGFPALLSLAVRRASSEERSAAVGTIAAGSQIAIGGGAMLLGGVAAIAGYRGMFATGAAAAIAGLLLLLRSSRERRETPGIA